MEERGIKQASRMTVVMLALAGSDMGAATPPTIRAALDRWQQSKRGTVEMPRGPIGAEAMSALVFARSYSTL